MANERAFTDDELTGLQAAQTAHMMDKGTLDPYTDAGADAFGNPNPSWPTGSVVWCGYREEKPDEVQDESNVPIFDATIRFDIDTVIDTRDRFTLTHRHGVALTTAITHEFVGQPQRGPSGLVARLKVVTDGS